MLKRVHILLASVILTLPHIGIVIADEERALAFEAAERPTVVASDLANHVSRKIIASRLRAWAAQNDQATDSDRIGAVTDAQAIETIDYLKVCYSRLDRAEANGTLSSDLALAVVQAADSASSRLWGLPPELLSTLLHDEVDGTATKIAKWVERISVARSKSFLDSASHVVNDAKIFAKGNETTATKIEKLANAMAEISSMLQQISNNDSRNAVGDFVINLGELRESLSQQQVEAYNAWAVKQCRQAFDEILRNDTWAPGDGVGTPEARKIFSGKDSNSRSSLAEIDQKLLSVETARLLNDVIQRLMVNMTAKAVVASEIEMANPKIKRSINDF